MPPAVSLLIIPFVWLYGRLVARAAGWGPHCDGSGAFAGYLLGIQAFSLLVLAGLPLDHITMPR